MYVLIGGAGLVGLNLIMIIFLTSCTSSSISPKPEANTNQTFQPHPQVVNVERNMKVVMGQTVYVPVYSHIYYEDDRNTLNLAVTLSIRNTDLSYPIIINSVRYYDSNGKLLKEYLTRPIKLGALHSQDFVVARTDTSGGSGANFIVEWISENRVSEPIIEAVMIGTESTQGISFISVGKVIKSQNNNK